MTYRTDEMMVRAGRFVDGLKAAGVESFAGVPVISPCGSYCGVIAVGNVMSLEWAWAR